MMSFLTDLKKEYGSQDNRATAYPIYVRVQELTFVGVIADGYSVNCPYGDGEMVTEYKHPELEGTYQSFEEIQQAIVDHYEDDVKVSEECGNIEELNCGYIWVDREFFLTIKGAEAYMKANAHNHGKLRTYVGHFERRNFEMRELLEVLGFKEAIKTSKTGRKV